MFSFLKKNKKLVTIKLLLKCTVLSGNLKL